MFWWRPTRDELNQWVDSNLREFSKRENRSPKLSTEAWLQKHIITDLHAIFFYDLWERALRLVMKVN